MKSVIFVFLSLLFSVGASAVEKLNFPIGIATSAGDFTELVPANTPLPHVFSNTFANAENDQRAVTIKLSQRLGNKAFKTIAHFDAYGLPPKPKGTLHLKLRIEITQNKEVFISLDAINGSYTHSTGPFCADCTQDK